MKSKKWTALMWALSVIPALLVAALWARLPERVPTSWNFDGTVEYSGRGNLWFLAALGPGMALLFQFLPRIDPKRDNYEKFQGLYGGFAVIMELFVTVMIGIILTETLRPGTINVGKLVMVLVCLLFVGIGCILGKVKPNWFMGIRTPWALSDPDVWNKTHRLGGWVFFLLGLGNLPVALLCPEKVCAVVFFVTLMAGVALLYVMSYRFYKAKEKK